MFKKFNVLMGLGSVLIPFLCSTIQADVIVVTPEQAKRMMQFRELSKSLATRVEIDLDEIRAEFNRMVDSNSETTEIPLRNSETGEKLVLKRSGNTLIFYAIADNIGSIINIDHKIKNFSDTKSAGSVVIDRSFNTLLVYVIVGNVGTIINIDVTIKNGVTNATPAPVSIPAEVEYPTALSQQRYYVSKGTRMRFPRGYRSWNAETKQWDRVCQFMVDVEFDVGGWVYAD